MLIHILALAACSTQPEFRVRLDPSIEGPVSGRLVVYLIDVRASVLAGAEPSDAPFFESPQPMFGVDVREAAPGSEVVVGAGATAFPVSLPELAPGRYRARAVLDRARQNSSWRRELGNLFSDTVEIEIGRGGAAGPELLLSHVVEPEEPRQDAGRAEVFETSSARLTEFRAEPVTFRAGVRFPVHHDPARAYPAIFEVPGFGGDHTGALGAFHDWGRRLGDDSGALAALRESAFWITLDPEGPNGHHLFADSANNGPVGRALVEELIPALQARYNLIDAPSARLLRGHSSGGWSTLWLAITYPDTFGACWSSSPDPVDFSRMQLVDIYSRRNFYRVEREEYPTPPRTNDLPDTPSFRANGRVLMTIREENRMEEVLGPGNTSAQQWDSWFAVFGPRDRDGNPTALFEPETGLIATDVAERYRSYDIAERVRRDAGVTGLIFHQRIRLLVGDLDNFYLNEAVSLLAAEVEKLSFFHYPEGRHGWIRVVEGLDHGSILGSDEARAIPGDMLEHLKRAGHAP